MRILKVRNVHEALPRALQLLEQEGLQRESRNGLVLIAPYPVTTIYERPCERVLFWKERDANPFFHLYESLWMLQGRNDLAPLVRYAKNIANFSDDELTLHGAYGHRWRHAPSAVPSSVSLDQLKIIADALRTNPDDRRCVLQMWNAWNDLGTTSKDVPCNTIATFQRDSEGRLDLTMFCRSNDIVWGAYGANAVHFSILLEYMALWIGCPVGVYRQISVNWHGYLATLEPLRGFWQKVIDPAGFIDNPYHADIFSVRMQDCFENVRELDEDLRWMLRIADGGELQEKGRQRPARNRWTTDVWKVLEAHEVYRRVSGPDRYRCALDVLDSADPQCDWVAAARGWLNKRYEAKLAAAS